jgi:hypothetical protein
VSISYFGYILFWLLTLLANSFKLHTMIYVLHHSKGALMLSAQDKDQVLKWTQRQLGARAGMVSISEKDFSETDGLVEKGGTGITAREAEGCQPLMSIMADFIQNVSDAEESHMESDSHVSSPRLEGRTLTVH